MSEQKSSKQTKRKVLDPSQLKGRRFGRVLTKLRIVTRDQVHEALAIQKVAKKKGDFKKVGQIMLEMGIIKDVDILEVLAGQHGFLRRVRLEKYVFYFLRRTRPKSF